MRLRFSGDGRTRARSVCLLLLFAVLSATAAFVQVSSESSPYWSLSPDLTTCALFVLGVLAGFRLISRPAGPRGWMLALAGVYSLFSVVGGSLLVAHSFAPLCCSLGCGLLALVRLAGFWAMYYSMLVWLCDLVGRCRLRATGNVAAAGPRRLSLRGHAVPTPAIALVIGMCWSVYLVLFFPGGVLSDTSRQLAQLFGGGQLQLTSHFPYLTTLLFGGLYSLGSGVSGSSVGGILAMSLFQIVFGVAVFATIIHWLVRLGAPKWLCWGSIAFCALFPLFPTYAILASKDYLHACLVALYATQICLLVVTSRGGRPAIASWPAIALVAVLVALTRNNGIFIVVASLVALLLLHSERMRCGLSLAAVLVCFGVWQYVVLPACSVASGEPSEVLSVPMQVVGKCLADGGELSEQDREVIEETFMLDVEALGAAYIPELSDGMKNQFLEEQISAFLQVFVHVAASDPASALAASLNTTMGFWYPFYRGSYWAEDSPYISDSDDAWACQGLWLDDAEWVSAWKERVEPMRLALRGVHEYLPVVRMLYRPATYVWLVLFMVAYALQTRSRRRLTVFVAAPFLMLTCTLLAGPCSSLRYSLPFIYALPILLCVLCSPSVRLEGGPARLP